MLPFEKVVEQHGATVLRVVRASLAPADADDAWSETFLAALRAYPSLPVDANVEAWLVVIARRKVIDLVRSRDRRAVPTAEPPEPTSAPGTAPLADLDLLGAVATLPPRQRRCVAYHYLADLPYDDVAALLGGTPAAARRAAADGIATLRRTYLEKDPSQ